MNSNVKPYGPGNEQYGLVPVGFGIGLGAVVGLNQIKPDVHFLHPGDFEVIRFVHASIQSHPILCLGAVGFLSIYILISAEARRRGASTAKLLALFKSTGFSVSLALVAVKLPGILERSFEAASAIAPVYHTIGWITAAVAAMCLLECCREARRLLKTHPKKP